MDPVNEYVLVEAGLEYKREGRRSCNIESLCGKEKWQELFCGSIPALYH